MGTSTARDLICVFSENQSNEEILFMKRFTFVGVKDIKRIT